MMTFERCPNGTVQGDKNSPNPLNARQDQPANSIPVSELPARLDVGQVVRLTLGGEPVVVVGASPVGHPVILSPDGWGTLQMWKFDKLSTATGRVVAYAKGIQQPAARFLCGIAYVGSKGVVHANGNQLDLRPDNLIVWPWSRIKKERERRRMEWRRADG